MLTRFEFKQTQNRLGGCNQVRITTNPLGRLADGGTVSIQPASHIASCDRQILNG
jgi:hypothetical protein